MKCRKFLRKKVFILENISSVTVKREKYGKISVLYPQPYKRYPEAGKKISFAKFLNVPVFRSVEAGKTTAKRKIKKFGITFLEKKKVIPSKSFC
jgi:hypothetical protein